MTSWYVYIIEATDSRLYTGITTDVERRWDEHAGNTPSKKKGAKFFRGRKPKYLRFVQQIESRSLASQLESKIKKISRAAKIELIESPENQFTEYKSLPIQSKTGIQC
jgi:putative endonuclease